MAISRPNPVLPPQVDEGWELGEPRDGARSLHLVDAVGEIESRADAGDEEPSPADAAGEIDAGDGWRLVPEPAPAPRPHLEVLSSDEGAVPVPVYDDGWAIAADRASLTAEEAAFFEEGESLAERAEPVDNFADLGEDRGTLWDRLRAWLRRR